MSDFKAYGIVLKTFMRTALFDFGRRNGFKKQKSVKTQQLQLNQKSGNSTAKKVLGGVLVAILALFFVVYIVSFAATMSAYYIKFGMIREFLYAALMLVQVAVMLFGSMAVLNCLYFGNDNSLLLNLPIKTKVIFAGKFTVAYLSELIISVFLALPVLITFGVSCALEGIEIWAGYYVLSVLSVFLLPIFPLLFISIIVIPIMYLVSFCKNKEVGKTIVTTVITLLISCFYIFIAISSSTSSDEEVMMQSNGLIDAMGKAGVFNYNLTNALLGEKAFLNFFIYLAGIVVIFLLVLLISGLFYRKGIGAMVEGSAKVSKKKNSEISFQNGSFVKGFLLKEFKTILSTPSILLSFLISVVFLVVYSVFMSKTNMFYEEGEVVGMRQELASIGFLAYLASIFIVATNVFATIGFSIERKNICILKSLPIRPKDILNIKVASATAMGGVIALLCSVMYTITSSSHNPLVAIALFLSLSINCFSASFMGLHNDIKKPQFNFTNINQLTNNNKRLLKPMLINILISAIYIVMGFVLASVESISVAVAYIIFFAVAVVINGLLAVAFGSKLYKNIDILFERMEP